MRQTRTLLPIPVTPPSDGTGGIPATSHGSETSAYWPGASCLRVHRDSCRCRWVLGERRSADLRGLLGQVRADGIVDTLHGYTERKASKYSSAEVADCQDVGPDAAGSVFPEPPRNVATWTFTGYPPAKVLGVRSGRDSFAVFVADFVAPEEREQIYEDLARGSRARNFRTWARSRTAADPDASAIPTRLT